MRTALAALEFDPHNAVARATLRDVLARKAFDSGTADAAGAVTGEAAVQLRRYNKTVRRMCGQLLTARTEREREMESLLKAIPSASASTPVSAQSAWQEGGNVSGGIPSASASTPVSAQSAWQEGGNVSGGGGAAATIATDEQQRPVYALVNLTDTGAAGGRGGEAAAASTAMMHPLWVRLPHGVDVDRTLELVGGLFGVVQGAVPLVAPVERGDLVVFELRRNFFRFDVTRVVRPRDGVVVEVPCVLQHGRRDVTTCVLRCASAPSPVYDCEEDRVPQDPLQWLDTTSAAAAVTNDVVEQILGSRLYLQRWLHVAQLGSRPVWFRDVPVDPRGAAVWRLHEPNSNSGADERRVILAAAAFPFACGQAAEEADDPFGASSEAVFALQPQGANSAVSTVGLGGVNDGVLFRVVGVFPEWGWD
ncbi:hypothetical protein DQ04_18251010 [Trypanosoma grayi]|uniref:hypothetical protein n=1 Tax=Trypanosoma grayi TaxID=71804 RepID=UPI0004F41C85|nr:hypothetical protein DQ04_18251010 [Trypanosoma grayi]KEG05808.1 hypothetical protein DQ04_18251010 [Trypanosoma grayi]